MWLIEGGTPDGAAPRPSSWCLKSLGGGGECRADVQGELDGVGGRPRWGAVRHQGFHRR